MGDITASEAATVARAKRDPSWWVRTVLGFQPWRKQREILQSVANNRVTAVKSCHAIGKSTTAAAAVLWFLANHPRSIVITTASSHRQVSGILWRELRGMYRRARFPIGGHMAPTAPVLKLADDWWAWGFTARDYDATQFQGFHAPAVMVVVDEAAGVRPAVYEGLDSAMSSGHARMLMIGNPTNGDGEFGKAFQSDAVAKFSVSAFDTPNFKEFGITIDDIRDGKGMDSGAWLTKINRPLPYPQLITPRWVREKYLRWGEQDSRWVTRVIASFPHNREGALWTADDIRQCRVREAPTMDPVVVAVDPPASSQPGAAEAGIVVAGRGTQNDESGLPHGYVLEDASMSGKPEQWAKAAVDAYRRWKADEIVGEANNGGDMVRSTIHAFDPSVRVRLVHASRGKTTRAEPVSTLYKTGRVHHVGTFPVLETQMTTYTGAKGERSPDRYDALMWAIAATMMDEAELRDYGFA